jgi:gamma-glutamylputrescine oxidase
MHLPAPLAGYEDTYYARYIALNPPASYSALDAPATVDVCVIGGGLAGVNTALALMQRGLSVMLLERHRLGWGASGRNGGFVARGYAADMDAIANRVGLDRARALVALTRSARTLIKKRIADFKIDCGPLKQGVLTVSWKNNAAVIQSYIDRINRDYDAGLEYWDTDRVRSVCKTDKYYQAYYSPDDFQFDSLRYLHGLAVVLKSSGAAVHENTPVLSIEKSGVDWCVRTPGGVVRANHVVLCCAADIGGLDRRLYNAHVPVKTYMMVTNPLSAADLKTAIDTDAALYDMRFASDYYRITPDNRILWGGRVGLWAHPKDTAKTLESDMLRVYPQLRGVARAEIGWAGTMCYPMHKMPQLGQMEPGYWYCTGFGGHGLVPTTVGAEAIAAAIACNDHTDLDLFKPFGLTYIGGRAGRYAAQMVYWMWRLRDYVELSKSGA